MTQDTSIALRGLSFRCRIDGQGDLPWVVFSNSVLTDLHVWDGQVAALEGRFRVFRYDQRGHGSTSAPAGPYAIADLGDDLLALLDHFGIGQFSFVGLSMGVPTGLHVVAREPGRVTRLVLCDGQAKTAPTGAAGWDERIAIAREQGMEAITEITMARWFAPEFVAAGRADAVRAMIASTPPAGYVGCAQALRGYDFEHVLARIDMPTQLIVGARDGAMPATMRNLRDAIKGAALAEIPDAGHIPNVEQPEEFNRVFKGFLVDGQPVSAMPATPADA